MIISTCSFGSTGSSAITDYLKEFNNIHVLDAKELTWIADVDGIIDLDYHLHHPHHRTEDSISAIERYNTLFKRRIPIFEALGIPRNVLEKSLADFLDSITMVSWKWISHTNIYHPIWYRIARRILYKTNYICKWQQKTKRQWEGFPYTDVHFSICPKNFDIAAKRHISDIFTAFGAKHNEHLAFDQLFPGNNPQVCFKYFEDPYAIVVDRDPRDVYTFGKTHLLSKGDIGHIMPLNSVQDFCIYYRALRDNQPYKENNERILLLHFEDLVYHYDVATKKIKEFLHLGENPHPKSIFDPSISIANTQVWKRYPEFQTDIEYIEKELKEYLFDFEGCPEPDKDAQMFSWKSPLNK